jgi:glycosyltransferase involved in cell wall biosynthesis
VPLFSIITVCLNPGSDLDPTVDSVLSQEFKDYELLLKDGGSTDGTQNRTWSDPRVRFISSPDKGIFDAMNQALGLARGDFVCFSNAGDYFVDAKVLGDVARIAKANEGADFFYADVRKPESRAGVELYPDRLSRSFLFSHTICHQCWFLKRSVYLAYHGFETAHTDAADCRLLLRVLLQGGVKYKHLPRIAIHYKGGGSSTVPERLERSRQWVDELRRELFSPLEYRAFTLMWKSWTTAKPLIYDRFLWWFWKRIQEYRSRRNHARLNTDY